MNSTYQLAEQLINQIDNFFPDVQRNYQTGVSKEEIENYFLKFTHLPQDMYDLYAWRNGSSTYIPEPSEYSAGINFLPIEACISESSWSDWDTPPTYKGSNLFPFIQQGPNFFATILDRDFNEKPYVVMISEYGESFLWYDNVNSMLASTNQCFQQSAFSLDDKNFWSLQNIKIARTAFIENNPKVIHEYLNDICESILIYGNDDLEQEEYSIQISPFIEGLEFLKEIGYAPLLPLVQNRYNLLIGKTSSRAYTAKHCYQSWLHEVTQSSMKDEIPEHIELPQYFVAKLENLGE